MLQLKNITKEYQLESGTVHALRGVTIDFRDNEFVAVLGPSGCGKTTLLNIVGGLDSYTDGDLVINGVSTREFNDAQWDAYRNHSVGFVFQSYNLIPHQSVLANVELALKLGHVTAADRQQRAMAALEKVGLSEHASKRPSMLSGGQMQRVAIARALVNDPDIILADEPTGALDSETSLQVLDLLKEVARDRLVIMVTHNPELADKYATRIVRLKDGMVVDDTMPVADSEKGAGAGEGDLPRRTKLKMSTALGLSLNNLRTKKGRTFLTAFAGAIGIIGIALILALSNGVNTYVNDIQRETMTSYPITIQSQTLDLSNIIGAHADVIGDTGHDLDGVYSDDGTIVMTQAAALSVADNNLAAFKEYLDAEDSPISRYLGDNGVVYGYNTSFGTFAYDPDGVLVSTNGVLIGESSSADGVGSAYMSSLARMTSTSGLSFSLGNSGDGMFAEMLPGTGDDLVSAAVTDSYDLLYGSWPKAADEVVLVLDRRNELELTTLYELGLLPSSEYVELVETLGTEDAVVPEARRWDYDQVCEQTLYMLPVAEQYVRDGDAWTYVGADPEALDGLIPSAIELEIVGVVRANEDANVSIGATIGYTAALTDLVIERTDAAPVVVAQKADPEVDVLTGERFDAAGKSGGSFFSSVIGQTSNLYGGMYGGFYDAMGLNTGGTYAANMAKFGVVDRDAPNSISIYVDTFESKDRVSECIDDYNASAPEGDRIVYTDYIGLLTSSVTTIVDAISYVLIAFVSISLVVSSIMIAIITYISVLERTKEIGVLRALGASKGDVSKIFNAETLIEGLLSGVIGVAVAALLCIPTNIIVLELVDIANVAILPWQGAVALVVISVVLTLVAGFIPSRIASKKDPAVALRTE